MRFFRYVLIVALVALAYTHLKPNFADFKQLPKVLETANFFFLSLAGAAIIGQYAGDGWLSKILLEITGHKINFKQTAKIAAINVFASHMVSLGQAGAIIAARYFYKKLGVTNQGFIFLTLAWAIVTNIVLLLFLIISLAFLPKIPTIPIPFHLIATIIISTIIPIIGITILLRKTIFKFLNKKLLKYRVYHEVKKFIEDFSLHKQNIEQNRKLVLKAFLAAFLYYSANIASLYVCFVAFHYYPNLAVVTATYLISLIVSLITLAPAGIGTAEATMILVFLQFNFDPTLTTAAVLAFRLFSFWLPIPAGAIAYFSLKRKRINATAN